MLSEPSPKTTEKKFDRDLREVSLPYRTCRSRRSLFIRTMKRFFTCDKMRLASDGMGKAPMWEIFVVEADSQKATSIN